MEASTAGGTAVVGPVRLVFVLLRVAAGTLHYIIVRYSLHYIIVRYSLHYIIVRYS